jgi:tripartite-type tricarboxylate transporter receptor subunit TctC
MKRKLWCSMALAMAAGLVLAACGGSTGSGDSSDYPKGHIQLIVPYAAGGPADLTGRLIAEYASKAFHQSVSVVNVEGGSGITGALQVIKGKADGYNLMIDSQSTGPALFAFVKTVPFKLDERTYISELAEQYPYFVASKKSGFTNLKDAMAAAKADPQSFAWAGGAAGSTAEIATLQLFKDAGVPLKSTREVVFQGGLAQSATAIASGQVPMGAIGEQAAKSLAAAGKVTILGVAAPERVDRSPDVPTAIEQGFPGTSTVLFQALAGPPGLPDSIVKKWQKVIADAVADPAEQAKAGDQGSKLTNEREGSEMTDFVNQQYAEFLELAKATGKR